MDLIKIAEKLEALAETYDRDVVKIASRIIVDNMCVGVNEASMDKTSSFGWYDGQHRNTAPGVGHTLANTGLAVAGGAAAVGVGTLGAGTLWNLTQSIIEKRRRAGLPTDIKKLVDAGEDISSVDLKSVLDKSTKKNPRTYGLLSPLGILPSKVDKVDDVTKAVTKVRPDNIYKLLGKHFGSKGRLAILGIPAALATGMLYKKFKGSGEPKVHDAVRYYRRQQLQGGRY